jgi:hypothetical protein
MADPTKFDPTAPLYRDLKTQFKIATAGKLGVALTFLTILGGIAVIAIVACSNGPNKWAQPAVLALAAAWGICGPMWFFYEYFFIYRAKGAADSWELFKHGQQLSATVWVALTATLTAVGTSDFIKGTQESYKCVLESAASSTASAASSPARVLLLCSSSK